MREFEDGDLKRGLVSGKARCPHYCGESLLCDPIKGQHDGVDSSKTPIDSAESASPRDPRSTARAGTQQTHPPASSHAHEHPPQRHPIAAPLAAAAHPSLALRIIGADIVINVIIIGARLMRHGIPSHATAAPHRPVALSPAAPPPRPRPFAGSVPVCTSQCRVALQSSFTGGGAATIREPAWRRVRGRAALGRRVTGGVGRRRVVPPLL